MLTEQEALELAVKEMKRYLPVLKQLENIPNWWNKLAASQGIATVNGFENAIKKAQVALAQKQEGV